jgi:hypothetical protein
MEDAADTQPLEPSGLQYLESDRVAIGGTSCVGMIIRAATGKVLGRLHGFVIDPIASRLRYLVVRTPGVTDERTELVSLDAARVDVENNAIEVPTERYA